MTEERLNWENLKRNKCPKCESSLKATGILICDFMCSGRECGFKVNEKTYQKITTDRFKRITKSPRDGQVDREYEFNNMGRKEVSEDFSDSPFADRA